MLADDEALLSFFDRRVPAEIANGKTFEDWRERAEAQDPNLLVLGFQDVLGNDQTSSARTVPGLAARYSVSSSRPVYRFEPGADDDGVSLRLPLVLVPQLGQGQLSGTIPAWRERKLAALLDELPRALRRELGDIKQLAAELALHLADSDGPLLEQLARGLFELRGIDVEPSQFRPEAISAYLHFYFRVVGERGQLLGEGRDLAQLCERFAPAAREALQKVAPPQHLQRSGIVAWDFDDLPARVTRRVHGSEVSTYPALVERDGAIAIELFESAEIAERAHRPGVLRLLQLACKSVFSTLDKRVPPPLSRRFGLPASKAERAAFAASVSARLTAEAFALGPDVPLPRTRTDFQRLLALGMPRLTPMFEAMLKLLGDIQAELEKTTRALDAAQAQPSAAQASADIREQLDLLFPTDLLHHTSLSQLAHLPRYLSAARARLTRAIHDPRKDASKAEPLAPLLRAFAAVSSATSPTALPLNAYSSTSKSCASTASRPSYARNGRPPSPRRRESLQSSLETTFTHRALQRPPCSRLVFAFDHEVRAANRAGKLRLLPREFEGFGELRLGISIPSESLKPTARFFASASVCITLIDESAFVINT